MCLPLSLAHFMNLFPYLWLYINTHLNLIFLLSTISQFVRDLNA